MTRILLPGRWSTTKIERPQRGAILVEQFTGEKEKGNTGSPARAQTGRETGFLVCGTGFLARPAVGRVAVLKPIRRVGVRTGLETRPTARADGLLLSPDQDLR